MLLETKTQVRRPNGLRGVLPRYQVFDRRLAPPMTVAVFYHRDAAREIVVCEVYDDLFREFLLQDSAFAGRRFDWVIDVAADAPHDTRHAIIPSAPMPATTAHGAATGDALTLDAAVAACEAVAHYRVIQTSDPR